MKQIKNSGFIAVFLLLSSFSFAQTPKELVNDLSALIQNKNPLAEVFFTEYSGKLSINGNQIPLKQVAMYYSEKKGPMLVFQCIQKSQVNCIYKPKTDNHFEIFSIPMDDKESVDRAMEIVNQLR